MLAAAAGGAGRARMVLFKSTRGGESSVSYEAAVLGGYASDGGLYVPEQVPSVSLATLEKWAALTFQVRVGRGHS